MWDIQTIPTDSNHTIQKSNFFYFFSRNFMLNMKNIVIEATPDLLYYVHYLENTWIKQWDPGPGPLFLDFVRTNTTMLRMTDRRF